MHKFRPYIFFFSLILAAIVLACGSNPAHVLQSVTVSPATADAQDYPDGQVQFTAIGFFSTTPSPVTPLGTVWGACYQGATTSGVSIDGKTGMAQCASGAVGTYTVFTENCSGSGACCQATTACGGGCFVTGTAQLSCP